MKLDIKDLAAFLMENPVLTYKMRHQLLHRPLNRELQLWHKEGAAMVLDDHGLHMYGDEITLDEFVAQLESGRKYHFFGIPVRYQKVLEQNFHNIESEENCTAYTITREDLPEHSLASQESLTQADVDFVNDHWTYKHEGSREFFKHIIRSLPSSAIRIDGQLAGWAVCYDSTDDMINLGSLKVLEQYRKQGLGRKLSLDLVCKVLETGKTPMVHIVDSNIASKTLSMGMGFKPHQDKIFWGSGIKK